MTIYSNEFLLSRIDELTDAETRTMLKRIVTRPGLSKAARSILAATLMANPGHIDEQVQIASDRHIPQSRIDALRESDLMDHAHHIIMAAMHPAGPYQTRDILLIAAQEHGGNVPFITSKGISQQAKVLTGYLLSMAGFDRKSVYSRERRMPVKCWVSRHGWKKLTAELRLTEVRITLGSTDAQIPNPPSIGDFL
jgi:hypothetical protein